MEERFDGLSNLFVTKGGFERGLRRQTTWLLTAIVGAGTLAGTLPPLLHHLL